uniref:Uncharacterized protein n=1 Tax=Myoviridae sp. ctyD07 TaxID=2826716 RepID=A0A8S5NJF6_9CAUD|nr:MAG TPA: hypothetical protein [Myoviridae sp. ctyD07]
MQIVQQKTKRIFSRISAVFRRPLQSESCYANSNSRFIRSCSLNRQMHKAEQSYGSQPF